VTELPTPSHGAAQRKRRLGPGINLGSVVNTVLRAGFVTSLLASMVTSPALFAQAKSAAEQTEPTPALAMHGQPKYGENFTHFEHVNPNAPKGGTLKLGAIGTFDNLNPFIPKGVSADGLGYLFQTLMTSSLDEPFTAYGLIAEKIEVPEDRSWVIFHLRPKVTFADNSPVTAEDVIFSFNILVEKGKPHYQYYYANVKDVQALTPQQVKFSFKPGDNHELPLILGQIPVLSKKYWSDKDFDKVSLETPLGNGPYIIDSFDPGRRITYKRNPNYWGADLPVNKGRNNFDKVVYEYFLDPTVALEAFKSGKFHFQLENNSKVWATQYQGKPFDNKEILTVEIAHEMPAGMQGFAFNLRNPLFQDVTLRKAMAYAFDFHWSNSNLFYGQYRRTRSYFQNTELAAAALPDAAELKVLKPIKDKVPEEFFTTVYNPPESEDPRKARRMILQGQKILTDAGYTIKNNQLYSPKGDPVKFEFLIRQGDGFDRIVLPFKKNLARMGIELVVRGVDITQYTERLRKFDFDMVVTSIGQSLSPGNEQRDLWSSAAADRENSRNIIGVKNEAIDYLVEQIISATSREELIVRARALDRVLQWHHLVIPNWHVNYFRVAHWAHLEYPKTPAKYGFDLMSWWQKPGANLKTE
jgi:microcin C transport system substrate-binding protein